MSDKLTLVGEKALRGLVEERDRLLAELEVARASVEALKYYMKEPGELTDWGKRGAEALAGLEKLTNEFGETRVEVIERAVMEGAISKVAGQVLRGKKK